MYTCLCHTCCGEMPCEVIHSTPRCPLTNLGFPCWLAAVSQWCPRRGYLSQPGQGGDDTGQILAVLNQVQTAALLTARSLFPCHRFPGFFYTSFQGFSFCVVEVSLQFPAYCLVPLMVIFIFTIVSFGQTHSRQCWAFFLHPLCSLTFAY